LLVLTLLVVTRVITPNQARAESPAANENPGAEGGEINLTVVSPTTLATPVVLPDAPVPLPAKVKVNAKVIDKKFIAVMAALGGAEALRFTTHKLVLDNEFAAGAPWVQSVPANQHLVAKYAGIYAAELLVAYEIKKPHSWLPEDKVIRKFWWAFPAAMTAIHIKNGVRSIRTQAPAGCPPKLCEEQ
jgi:hypothetical protein